MHLHLRLLCCVLATALVGGCSTGSAALGDSARLLYDRTAGGIRDQQPSVFNPSFRYLRVTHAGTAIYMVLGYLDPTPEGTVEVWYSGEGEVVRLLDGRVVGTTGLNPDWRRAQVERLPLWPVGAQAQTSGSYLRVRDVMPGYHLNIRETVRVTPLASYTPAALQGARAASLRWFEEQVTESTSPGPMLPPARFGIAMTANGSPSVVYSEQCLSAEACYTFERWSAPSATATPTSAGS